MENETGNELVVRDQDGGQLVLWPKEGIQYSTSLGNTPTDIDKRVACMSTGPTRLRQYVGQVIEVTDWFLHHVDRVDEATGEVTRGPRLVMATSDGELISTSIKPVISTLGHLLSLTGFRKFDPPRRFAVSEVKTTGSKAYLTITPAIKSKGK